MAKPTAPEEMGFIDHLEELRSRLIQSLIALVLVAIGCAYFSDYIVNELLISPLKPDGFARILMNRFIAPNMNEPVAKLQNLVPYGQVSLYFQAVFFSSLIIVFPFLALQIWRFVSPGLLPRERKASRFIVLFVSSCFFVGVLFGYFVVLPFSLRFFASFGSPMIENNIAVGDYVSFFIGMILTSGLVFELPFISYILSKIGLLTPPFMREYRRHAVVVILILAAIVTPSTDMVTQLIFAIPMMLLYEISIVISAVVKRRKDAEERAESLA